AVRHGLYPPPGPVRDGSGRPGSLDHRRPAAVDVDGRTGDVAARIGGEEAGDVRKLLRLAEAAERDPLARLLQPLFERETVRVLVAPAPMLVADEKAGAERVHRSEERRVGKECRTTCRAVREYEELDGQ